MLDCILDLIAIIELMQLLFLVVALILIEIYQAELRHFGDAWRLTRQNLPR